MIFSEHRRLAALPKNVFTVGRKNTWNPLEFLVIWYELNISTIWIIPKCIVILNP